MAECIREGVVRIAVDTNKQTYERHLVIEAIEHLTELS